jgi:hypothetical protein
VSFGHPGLPAEGRDERSKSGHDGVVDAVCGPAPKGLAEAVRRLREASPRTSGKALRERSVCRLERCPYGTAGLSADRLTGPPRGCRRVSQRCPEGGAEEPLGPPRVVVRELRDNP